MSRFNIISPTNGQVLTYDSTNDWWENANASGGGGSDPWTYVIVSSQVDSTSTTPTNLASFTPAANKIYEFEFRCFLFTTTSGNAARLGVSLPTVDCTAGAHIGQINSSGSANAAATSFYNFGNGIGGGVSAVTQSPSGSAIFYAFGHGVCKTGASPSGDVIMQLASEVSAVGTQSAAAGSFMRYREVS